MYAITWDRSLDLPTSLLPRSRASPSRALLCCDRASPKRDRVGGERYTPHCPARSSGLSLRRPRHSQAAVGRCPLPDPPRSRLDCPSPPASHSLTLHPSLPRHLLVAFLLRCISEIIVVRRTENQLNPSCFVAWKQALCRPSASYLSIVVSLPSTSHHLHICHEVPQSQRVSDEHLLLHLLLVVLLPLVVVGKCRSVLRKPAASRCS